MEVEVSVELADEETVEVNVTSGTEEVVDSDAEVVVLVDPRLVLSVVDDDGTDVPSDDEELERTSVLAVLLVMLEVVDSVGELAAVISVEVDVVGSV